ncbi:MAG: hypothetical protein K9L68_12990 [Spirochaetales bacterium]|nr:hypothetical protein [Spirochaetales bacterium]
MDAMKREEQEGRRRANALESHKAIIRGIHQASGDAVPLGGYRRAIYEDTGIQVTDQEIRDLLTD